MNISIIGLGVMGKKHLRVCSEENLNIISTYDPISNQNYNQFLNTLSEADGVIISSPTKKHVDNILDCLKYNPDLKILCEKPISDNTRDQRLNHLIQYSDSILVGQIERFNNSFIKLKGILNKEEIIQIKTKRVNNTSARENIHCKLDIGIHDLDLCCNLCRGYPEKINIFSNSDYSHENLFYKINKIQITNEISWQYPFKSREIQVLTCKGVYFCDLFKQKIRFIDWAEQEISLEVFKEEPLKLELLEFKKMYEEKKTSISTIENNIKLLKLMGY